MNTGFLMFAGWGALLSEIFKRLTRKFLGAAILMLLFISLLSFNALAQKDAEWPCFHGVERKNKSLEKGLLKAWPPEGPELKWSASGLGKGYSSVAVADGFIYTAGMRSGQAFVFCYDTDGNFVWEKPNGRAWSANQSFARAYTGARSTPTYDDGIVYHLGETGRLAAFDAKTGKEFWAVELKEAFDAGNLEYGYAESVLIKGDHLYVRPAGEKGFQVCLNKKNGKLIWKNNEIPGAEGYSSPVVMKFGGYAQLINASSNCYYGIDTETGRLLWKVDYENQRERNVADAIVHKDYVFFSSGYGKGSMLMQLKTSEADIQTKTIWQSDLMDNHHGGVILHKGYLYGSGSKSRGWFCLDFFTGEQMWKTSGKGSLTFADGMFYLLDERGTMSLVRATPEDFEPAGKFEVPAGGRGMYWAHPVVCNGTLYIRHANKLFAYDIKGE